MSNEQEGDLTATTWPDYIWADYRCAVIRLVTLSHNSPPHLIFASVELLPDEIPPPDPIGPQFENFGDYRLTGSLIVRDVPAAVAWYESAAKSNLHVLATCRQIPIATVPLGPEPEFGRLVVAHDPPIVAKWHEGTRVHRLVPLASPPDPVASFLIRAQNSPRWMKLRTWIADRVHCDLLVMDDCLGGMILLVPNPLIRSFSETQVLQPNGKLQIQVRAIARHKQNLSTLQVRLREEREDGLAMLTAARLDEDGRVSFACPGSLRKVQAEIECDIRGPLKVTEPGYFIGHDIRIDMFVPAQHFAVAVPARRRGEVPTTRVVSSLEPWPKPGQTEIILPSPSIRLAALKAQRMARSGDAAPGAPWKKPEEEENIFFGDREAATTFLLRLLAQAREHVVFVDPYFDYRDLCEFALALQWPSCAVTVLTGRREPKWGDRLPEWEGGVRRGEALLTNLEGINRQLESASRPPIRVLVMGEPARTYHDRFLVVDEQVWHFGHSFNRIGYDEVSFVSSVRKPRALWTIIQEDIKHARRLSDVWPDILKELTAGEKISPPSKLKQLFLVGTIVRHFLARWWTNWVGWLINSRKSNDDI